MADKDNKTRNKKQSMEDRWLKRVMRKDPIECGIDKLEESPHFQKFYQDFKTLTKANYIEEMEFITPDPIPQKPSNTKF